MHGCHQLADLVTALHLDAGTEVTFGDLPRQADHPAQGADDQQADQRSGGKADEQGQARRQQYQQRAGVLLGTHVGLLQRVGLLHRPHHARGGGGQMCILLALLFEDGGVFLEALIEGVDVADHLGEHGGIAGVLHGIAQLGGELLRVQGFLDLRCARLVGTAALFQAQARLVQRLQEQLVDAADLPTLGHQVGTLGPLRALQQVDAILIEAALQHIEAVGRAHHQPVGRLQGEPLVVGKLHIAVESAAILGHGLGDFAQGHATGAGQPSGQGFAARDDGLGLLSQRFCLLGIAGKGIVLLGLPDRQHIAADVAHLLQQAGPLVHRAQCGEAGCRHHQGQRQHGAKAQHQLVGGAQAGQPTLQDSPHAPTSPQGDYRMDAIRFPEASTIGAAQYWRQAIFAPPHPPMLFLANWRSLLNAFHISYRSQGTDPGQ
ncbi:hypothetical protein D9M68_549680 [compost metagenome]